MLLKCENEMFHEAYFIIIKNQMLIEFSQKFAARRDYEHGLILSLINEIAFMKLVGHKGLFKK